MLVHVLCRVIAPYAGVGLGLSGWGAEEVSVEGGVGKGEKHENEP